MHNLYSKKMERLNGRTILIGRDPGVSNFCISIKETGKSKSIGNPGCIPYSISRCIPAEGKGHASIKVDDNGNLKLYNENPNNCTFVDGVEISICRVEKENIIELGKDKIKFTLSNILDVAKDLLPVKPMDISHLKEVYENYQAEKAKISEAREIAGKKRMLPIMVSSASGVATAIVGALATSTLWVTVPVSGIVSYLYFRNYKAKDSTRIDENEVNERFQENYVCPVCHKFIGNYKYDRLKVELKDSKDGKLYCSKCRCELIAK